MFPLTFKLQGELSVTLRSVIKCPAVPVIVKFVTVNAEGEVLNFKFESPAVFTRFAAVNEFPKVTGARLFCIYRLLNAPPPAAIV